MQDEEHHLFGTWGLENVLLSPKVPFLCVKYTVSNISAKKIMFAKNDRNFFTPKITSDC